MGPKTTELVRVLDQLATILESDGEQHWRAWMLQAKTRLEQSDYSGIAHLLGAYGGMGSFNDLVLGQTLANGRFAWKAGHNELNKRLGALRSKAWELAQAIKRSYDVHPT
jgi:hypothetical protein